MLLQPITILESSGYIYITVEPPYKGHLETSNLKFVLNIVFFLCIVSFIGGFTVYNMYGGIPRKYVATIGKVLTFNLERAPISGVLSQVLLF